MNKDFSFSISHENAKLPKYLIDEQFYSNYYVKINENRQYYIIYYISCTIERNYYMNNYKFYLKYNKEKDYYILNDKNGNTVENIFDIENDFSIIEEPLMNNILINLCGHIPKLYFGDQLNIVYSKIHKYINNNLFKLSKYFKKKIQNIEDSVNHKLTLEDIKKYDFDLYFEIQKRIILLFIKIENKGFIIRDVEYKIQHLYVSDLKLNNNYNFKIQKKNLKINNVKYLY